MHIKKILLLFLLSLFISSAFAESGFIVQDIRVEGLQRISKETVLNYLPIARGQSVNAAQTSNMIHTLYDTGFFKNVMIARQGNVLVIKVVERSTIGNIKVSGNQTIDKDKLKSVFKDIGLVEGRVYSPAVLEKVKHGLLNEYHNRGNYTARVDTTVTDQPRNRVAIRVDISEGRIAKVREITIIGNHAFTSRELLKHLDLSTPGLITFFTKKDQYARPKLESSLEALRSYYMDRGYVRFKVDDSRVLLTPDHKDVYIVIHVTEGGLYKVKGVRLVGDLILPEATLRQLIHIKTGDIFSRQQVTKANKAIAKELGDRGYAFANINTVPEIDDQTKQVFLTFYIEPGNRVYVRRIKFVGNTQTSDEVLRRELRQMEGGLVSVSQIKESVHRLKLLGFLQEAKVDTLPVENSSDQVDLQYQVTESPPATATAGISYGTDGFGFNANVNNNNFLGTGKTIGVGFDKTPFVRTYSVNYNNPYYTIDGIQRGFTLYSQRYTPGSVNVANYTYNNYGGGVNYSIPISAKNDSIQLGLGYQKTFLNVGSSPSNELNQFVQQNGTHFNHLILNGGWSRNGFDRAIFPTQGLNQVTSLQVWVPAGTPSDSKPLEYYKASYNAHWYHPITDRFIFSALGGVGYGNSYGRTQGLPFFQNYFAGGIGYNGAVRGYASNSLGPRDSQGNPLGGNMLLAGSLGLVFPNPISPDKLRTTVFVDAGNVYNTRASTVPLVGSTNPHGGPIRYSTGLAAEWRLPIIGVLDLSVAKALNAKKGDQLDPFQFTFGVSF